MTEVAAPYHFRPFARADLRMAAGWLRTPEVVHWWGTPADEETLITQDLDEPSMRQWIVEHKRRPFAYAQAYPAHAWPQPHLALLPPGAMAIDVFIGDPTMLGIGHGKIFLHLLAEMLLAEGAPVVATDPALDNHRARRAYARAGFVEERVIKAEDGPVVLMLYRRTPIHRKVPGTTA